MTLDAVIIAGSGSESFSGTNPLKLKIDGHVADIQTVLNFVENNGHIKPPIIGSGKMSWASTPKLNGIYLISYLTKRGFSVALIDSFFDKLSNLRLLAREKPLSIVISTTFITNCGTLIKMVHEIRNICPEAKIIIGGPFVYASYLLYQRAREPDYLSEGAGKDFLFTADETLPAADLFVIDQQGEQVLSQALLLLKNRGDFSEIPNTAALKNGVLKFSHRSEASQPEEDSINWEKLPDDIFMSGVVPLQASKGCPFNCAFCNFVKDRRNASVKPLDLLVAEMNQIQARGAAYVWFVDDNFRLGKPDLEAVCHRFIHENTGLKWMTFIRASALDAVDPELLKRAGCVEVQLGLESADNQVLKNMNKKVTVDLYDRVLFKLLSNGINCSCYLIFGFPGETDQSVQRTIDFMRRHEAQNLPGALSWSIFPFLLAPLSPIYEKDARTAYRLSGHMKHWQHSTMNSETAMEYVLRAFLEIEHSGPIYRDDNQDVLRNLDLPQRKRFFTARHTLSKKAMLSQITKEEIFSVFKGALGY
ncbi:MAG: radical SAM protein [Desulfobacterales bacterium]